MLIDNAPDAWVNRRIKEDEILKYMDHGRDFIPDDEIEANIRQNEAQEPDPQEVRAILAKSMAIVGSTNHKSPILFAFSNSE